MATYRAMLTRRGALPMSLTGLAARLPVSMMTLGIVVAVSSVYGSYTLAGQVSAAYVVGDAGLAIVQGRLTDRFGQLRMLCINALLFGGSTALLVVAIVRHAGFPWPHLFAALAGAAVPQVGAMVRARWAELAEDDDERQTAFSWESAADEVVYVTGPALVTTLSTVVAAQAGLLFALVVGALGPLALAVQRRTEPPSRGEAQERDGAMPWRTVVPLGVAGLALGAVLGANEVATVAVASDQGHRSLAGVLLAALAVGSLVAALLNGRRDGDGDLLRRVRLGVTWLAVGFAVLSLVGPLWLLALVMVATGFAVAPTMVAASSLVEKGSPPGRLTEAMAWWQTGLSAGIGPGSWIAGVVADHAAPSTTYLVSTGAAVVSLLATVAVRRPPSD
ncbi:MAG: MFS transporter [Marmoricola sp.]